MNNLRQRTMMLLRYFIQRLSRFIHKLRESQSFCTINSSAKLKQAYAESRHTLQSYHLRFKRDRFRLVDQFLAFQFEHGRSSFLLLCFLLLRLVLLDSFGFLCCWDFRVCRNMNISTRTPQTVWQRQGQGVPSLLRFKATPLDTAFVSRSEASVMTTSSLALETGDVASELDEEPFESVQRMS